VFSGGICINRADLDTNTCKIIGRVDAGCYFINIVAVLVTSKPYQIWGVRSKAEQRSNFDSLGCP